ncbi:hypothetical protein E5S69_04990 [Cupriavidus necator]|uniref:Lar family restriction alleviation protein n=1 Tax=Cupriavidus necator TaxID=106590 RepID=UPI00148F7C45|nr:Lar family restriction alleviation protein [Cupriavidus necator]NOV22892.1 hypothetical protein [Cupriavidus necator]
MTTPATTPADLLPCPFCGAGETVLHVNKGTWNGQGYGEPVSIEIRHWCPQEPGQPSRPILRIGRDEASAIAAWNRRATPSPGKADAEMEERPSLSNPLTAYGMLVRALRMVANTSLYEMAQAHGVKPSDLSAMEFGRKPVTIEDVAMADRFFADRGVQGTIWPLTAAMHADAAIQQERDKQ